MSHIYFGISSNIEADSIIAFCCKKLNVKHASFIVVEDFFQYCVDHEVEDENYFIQYAVSSGQFDAWVKIYTKDEYYSDIENSIAFMKEISQALDVQIVTGTESVDPFNFILIEPSGITSTFDVDYDSYNERDEINFGQFDNQCFGQFALKEKLDKKKVTTVLAEIFKEEFSEFNIQFGTSGPVINGSFDKNKLSFSQLKNYQYHYDIIPKGKQNWYSQKRKSEIFLKKITAYSHKENIDICIFPADYSEVENIEGGSDSEDYCINCTKGKTEKIIYKTRRKSWKKS